MKPRSNYYEQSALESLVADQNSSFLADAGVQVQTNWSFMHASHDSQRMISHVPHPMAAGRWPLMCKDAVAADMWHLVSRSQVEEMPVDTPFPELL